MSVPSSVVFVCVAVLSLSSCCSTISVFFFFFSSRRRHTRFDCDWSSDVCSSDLWCRHDSGDVTIGITSIYAAVAGRIAKVSSKPLKVMYPTGTAIGFVESPKHFGPIRTPIGGVLLDVNELALRDPRKVTDSPYGEGWVARLRPSDFKTDRAPLLRLPADRGRFEKQIGSLRVRCFAAFPDHEMFEIGTECAAVLVKLNELLARVPVRHVVHLVADH